MKALRLCILALAGGCSVVAPARAAEVAGTVYMDENGNGRRDAGERGLPGVMVSDGRAVADTAGDGAYRLQSGDDRPLVWVSVPRDTRPAGPWYRWAEAGQAADFALAASPQVEQFQFVQITDSHIGRVDLLQQFCQRLNEFPLPLAFVINTGDLVGGADVVLPEKAPEQYANYAKGVAGLELPLLNLPGNHEHVGFNNKEADRNHPDFGKGLYRRLLGPMHYSWDWGPVHFVALDGTRLPYSEALGEEQRAWLAEDLKRQPAGKPLVLFCHQSLPALRDAKELAGLLAGRNVLAGFCGHLHATHTLTMGGFPVYHTGALSGSWWSGPNPDGSPQGFRLVSVRDGALSCVYSGREGPWSLEIRKPMGREVQRGTVPVEATVLDMGQDVDVRAALAGKDVPLKRGERSRWWSTWQGEVDTSLAPDGRAEIVLTAAGKGQETRDTMQFIARNGKESPATVPGDAVLKLQVRGVDAANLVEFNGQQLGALTPKVPNETWVEFAVPNALLRRLNTLVVRAVAPAGTDKDDFSVGPARLEVAGKQYYDLRAETFRRYAIGDAHPAMKDTAELYFCLP